MNKTIIRLLATLFSFTATALYSQENNRQPAGINNAQESNIFYHTVERGQTVYSIAIMYGVGEDDLYRLNPGIRQVIKIGEKLRIPQKTAAATVTAAKEDRDYTFHTIQPKETLYALSVKYNVPAAAIVEANPGLSVATFIIGKNIRIPLPTTEENPAPKEKPVVTREIEYKVERRETLYRISRKFNISSDELTARNPELKAGVKAGMVIFIPVTEEEEEAPATQRAAALKERDANALLSASVKMEKPDTIKVVLLLPFMMEEALPSPSTTRFIEYYEGMLLAIDSLRNNGISVRLTVRDCGNSANKLNEILKEPALQEAHLIIGAVENDQIAPVAAFAKKNGIKYVIPFTSRNDDVLSNASVFQVNTPHSYLYAKASQAAYDMFFDYNIIFVETNDRDDKTEFIRTFKQDLLQRNVTYTDLLYRGESFYANIEALLRKDKRNVIIPTSGTLEGLNKIRSPLRTLVESNPDIVVNLFGYPEWQTYVRECLEDFFILNTYIYTYFYADNMSPDVAGFYLKYKMWYSKNLANTFPKYGILGFDTGMFFLDAIYRYGLNFESSLDKINYKSLQTGFKFYRVNNWGGFINTNLFIVHYNKGNYKIIRHELKQ
ncbi:MAG: LysM peptidoglycan-binding domain-containing protein [Tannerellaceae bacterium]|jgi:LysM repeat protein|nr:LysM peptidoglycan-binding domain-containing protein [Tannerellaceae bacterium]